MPTIPRFDPPALLNDFDAIPHQRQGWSAYISALFDDAIARIEIACGQGKAQFYNQTHVSPEPMMARKVLWNAFPYTLAQRWGRTTALQLADTVAPLEHAQLRQCFPDALTRVQDEYCEWHVQRETTTHKILRVTFTCEGPEYWQSMAGGPSIYDAPQREPRQFGAHGDPQVLLQLYRDLLNNPTISLQELFVDTPCGRCYNPWNPWNTTDGIVHMQQMHNTLGAEILHGASATVARRLGALTPQHPPRRGACHMLSAMERRHEPLHSVAMKVLASEGRRLTLRNPIGVYMDHLDDHDWTVPGPVPGGPRVPVGNWWRVVRGTPDIPGSVGTGMVVRAVYEVPAGIRGPYGQQLTVSDIHIDGVPIRYGGQIAERIAMKLVALAGPAGEYHTLACEDSAQCYLHHDALRVGNWQTPYKATAASSQASLGLDTLRQPLPARRTTLQPATEAMLYGTY